MRVFNGISFETGARTHKYFKPWGGKYSARKKRQMGAILVKLDKIIVCSILKIPAHAKCSYRSKGIDATMNMRRMVHFNEEHGIRHNVTYIYDCYIIAFNIYLISMIVIHNCFNSY